MVAHPNFALFDIRTGTLKLVFEGTMRELARLGSPDAHSCLPEMVRG
jgi:hypothetical protein